jgi:NADPH-ferrihemoprotein reductase
MVVFWGTQSGTAKVLAKSLAREASARYNIKSMAADLDDYDHGHLADFPSSKIAVFILATYGEGDPADNTLDFCSVLGQFRCSEEGDKILEKLRYAAFGLGNKNYAKYNKVIDSVDESLSILGGQRLVAVGKGDESTGSTDRQFSEWKTCLFKFLETDLGVKENATLAYIPSVQVTENSNARPTMVYRGEPNKNHLTNHLHTAVNQNNPHKALITSARHLFDSPNRHCLHMELSIDGFPSQNMSYETGDHLAVWPSNPSSEVDRLIKVLGLEETKDGVVDVVSLEGEPSPVPTPTTRQVILRYYLEICCSPTRDTLSLLAQFAPNKPASKALIDLASSHESFKSRVTDNCLTLAQVLPHFKLTNSRSSNKSTVPPPPGPKSPSPSS